MKRIFPSIIIIGCGILLAFAALAIDVEFNEFYQATGIKLRDGTAKVEIGKAVDAYVGSPVTLSQLGFPDATENMEVKLSFKSDMLFEAGFPSLQKRAFFGLVQVNGSYKPS